MYKTHYDDTCQNCADECQIRSNSTVVSCDPHTYPVCSAWTRINQFECVEGEWVLLETTDNVNYSLIGAYYILRDPSDANIGQFDVVNVNGPGSGAYTISGGHITATNSGNASTRIFSYTLTDDQGVSGQMNTTIKIPTYFKPGSIPEDCNPPIYGNG